MRDPAKVLKEAANELAYEAQSKQFPDPITAATAIEYVGSDECHAWAAIQFTRQSAQSLLIELIEKHFDEDKARDVVAGLVNGLTRSTNSWPTDCLALVGKKLSSAMRQQVAEDLAYDAQKLVDNWEPTDAEMARTSYAAEVDDPIRGDRHVLASIYR